VLDRLEVEEILAHFLFADLIWGYLLPTSPQPWENVVN
jgi:hypothetical protein